MLSVVKTQSTKRVTTALLSGGQKVKFPVGQVAWGSVVAEEDIVKSETGSLCHKSMIPSKVSKPPKDYGLCRSLDGYDPKAELKMIRKFVYFQYQDVMGRQWHSEDEIDDLVSECVEIFTRRHLYEKYLPGFGGTYESYLKTSVYRVLLDYRRRLWSHPEHITLSLNMPLCREGGDEAIDFLRDPNEDLGAKYERKVLLERLRAKTTQLDKEGTGLPGFTYADILDIWINGESLDAYLSSFKYDRKLLDQYVLDFQKQLQEEVRDLAVDY